MSINKALSEPWQGRNGQEGCGGEKRFIGAEWGTQSSRKCCPSHCAGLFTHPRLKCLQKYHQSGGFCLPS